MNAVTVHLRHVISWARKLQEHLGELQARQGHRVHFRPSSGGVAMVSLNTARPQRGKTGYRNLARLRDRFEDEYRRHCVEIEQGRPTPEKRLQSFLISDAYQHDRAMHALNQASERTDDPVCLSFVTDELAIPTEAGKVVCDILAVRQFADGRAVPAAMELKSAREMTRLIAQVRSYAAAIEEHLDLFEELYSVLLGREIRLEGPAEKWIVWPSPPSGGEPREEELARAEIRVVNYEEQDGGFGFRVGRAVW